MRTAPLDSEPSPGAWRHGLFPSAIETMLHSAFEQAVPLGGVVYRCQLRLRSLHGNKRRRSPTCSFAAEGEITGIILVPRCRGQGRDPHSA